MKRVPVLGQVFGALAAVSVVAVLGTGLVARWALSTAFEDYLLSLPAPAGPGSGVGRAVFLGTAEHAFLAGVDRGMVFSAIVALVLAIVAAAVLARGLTGPLRRLTEAARSLASGSLDHRVEEEGPVETAALARAFNDMSESLEHTEELRRRQVTDVAHELRNPIAALRAQVEGMADGVLPSDASRLSSLASDVATLSRLVEDLQELSRAEAGALTYTRETFDLRGLVERETERARVMATTGVVVIADLPDAIILVNADEFRLAQVVRNLVSNALRHTTSGTVMLRVQRTDDLRARITVEDTGEGIAPSDLPRIWDRFYRADTSRSARTGGTGVGLAISRRIVEDHGGNVFAESSPGRGSAIGFDLPTVGDQDPAA